MKPIILIVSSLFIAFICCENTILKTQSIQHSNLLYNNVKKLLGTCFLNRTNPIISDKKFSDIIYEALIEESDLSPSVMLINEDLLSKSPKSLYLPTYPSYILPGDSPHKLKSILEQLKASQWWSTESIFMAVDLGTNSCKNAQTSLRVLWEMNLLSSFYVCTKNDLMIYMFNPFTDRAPKSWTEVEIGNEESVDPWTLYSQPYSKDQEFRESLFFDKTKKLDGYKIKAVANTLPNRKWEPNKIYNLTTMRDKLHLYVINVFTSIFSHMNVTPLIYFDLPGGPASSKNKGYVKGLVNGSYDIALNGRFAEIDYNVSHTYPINDLGLVILTQHREFLTTFEKICRFYSIGVILLSSLVLAMTSLLITIYYKRNFVEASLESLKMALSASTDIPLITFPIRIYFFGVFLLILIINATFQGHMASFLTKPERITVDSLSDLQELNYKIYLAPSAVKLIDRPSKLLRNKALAINTGIDCIQQVLDDPNVGCIGYIPRLLSVAGKNSSLHISPVFANSLVIFLERHDWPLKKKVDTAFWGLMETGLLHLWDLQTLLEPLKNLHFKESLLTEARYRPIRFKDIEFAFIILVICLLLTIIVFIFEFYYGYYIYCD